FISMDRVLCSPDRMEDFSSTTFPLDRAPLRCENRASSAKTIFNQVSAARVWLLPDPTVRRWFSTLFQKVSFMGTLLTTMANRSKDCRSSCSYSICKTAERHGNNGPEP